MVQFEIRGNGSVPIQSRDYHAPAWGRVVTEPRAVATGCYIQVAIHDVSPFRAKVELSIRSLPLLGSVTPVRAVLCDFVDRSWSIKILLNQRRTDPRQPRHALVECREAWIVRLPAMITEKDLLQHYGKFEDGKHFIESDVA